MIKTLPVFSNTQFLLASDLLSAHIATMQGRKMEESDWDFIYCASKNIPKSNWSNLHIDINHNGLGVEHKMLRITKNGTLLDECGTTKMHPAGTRSIRIPNESNPQLVMIDILNQYNELISIRTHHVLEKSNQKYNIDMRIGWLLWKETLDEFLYFEEPMLKQDPNNFYAEWNTTPAKGARKASKSLWIYDKNSGKKKYSITTTAGAKIQPYFDIPPPNDANLYHFKTQGVITSSGLVRIWLTKSTAKYLELLVGSLASEELSNAIDDFNLNKNQNLVKDELVNSPHDIAIAVEIRKSAYQKLKESFTPISDEYLMQQFAMKLGEKNSHF